jgi:hypothetical protein
VLTFWTPVKVGLANIVALLSFVTLFRLKSVLKLAAVCAVTVLSALILGKVIAEGLVSVKNAWPTAVPPREVRPVAGTKLVEPPSHRKVFV